MSRTDETPGPISRLRFEEDGRWLWRTGAPLGGRLRVASRARLDRLRQRAGTAPLAIPGPPLEHGLLLQGGPEIDPSALMAPDLRAALARLAGLCTPGELDVSLLVDGSPQGLFLTGQFEYGRHEGIRHHAEAVAGRFLASLPRRVPAPEPDGNCCLLCGHGFSDMAWACSRCGRRHHHECWQVLDECGRFGCGARTAVQVPVRSIQTAVPVVEIGGVPCRITQAEGEGATEVRLLRIHFDFRAPGTLHIGPERFFDRLFTLLGSQDIELGDPALDPILLIRGKPEEWVRQVLDFEGRVTLRHMLDLSRGLLGGSGLEIIANASGVIFTVPGGLNSDRLRPFLDQARFFLERLRARQTLLLAEVERGENARCPVCAQAISGRVVHCDACRTPHHAECWSYFGGCAIYACASRR